MTTSDERDPLDVDYRTYLDDQWAEIERESRRAKWTLAAWVVLCWGGGIALILASV